jgi:exodeoxyribonuclease VII small subunit
MARKETHETETREPTFEQALERLEAIVRRMEAGAMGLDDMVGAFEEGQRLIALCTGKLNEVENRIERLVKDQQGALALKPLDENGTGAAEPA